MNLTLKIKSSIKWNYINFRTMTLRSHHISDKLNLFPHRNQFARNCEDTPKGRHRYRQTIKKLECRQSHRLRREIGHDFRKLCLSFS